MDTTASLLDRLAAKYGGASDYRLAQVLGIARQQVSHYRAGRNTIGDALAVRVAAELGEPAGYVLACLAAERARVPAIRRAWQETARAVRAAGKAAAAGLAAASVAGLLFVASPGVARAAGETAVKSAVHDLYIMRHSVRRSRRRRRRRQGRSSRRAAGRRGRLAEPCP